MLEGLYFFRDGTVVLTDDRLLTDFSLRESTSVSLRALQLIGSTSLEKRLLISHKELLTGLSFLAYSKTNHKNREKNRNFERIL